MRQPWVQVAMELIEVSAPELAIELDVSEAEAGWWLVKLIPWALARCPDHLPPSESALVEGNAAARKIAAAVGYTGDPEVFVSACERLRYAPLERTAYGIRLRGLDRYDAGWGSNHRELWAEWKDYRAGLGPRPGATPRPETLQAPATPPPRSPHPPPAVKTGVPRVNTEGPQSEPMFSGCPDADADADADLTTTTTGERTKLAAKKPVVVGEDFWGPTREVRLELGLSAPDDPPPKWTTRAEEWARAGFSPADVARAHRAYARDPDFAAKGWPIGIFLSPKVHGERLRRRGPEPDASPAPPDPAFEAAVAASLAEASP